MKAWRAIVGASDPRRAFAEHLCTLLADTPAERALAAPLAAEIESVTIVGSGAQQRLRATMRNYVIDCAKPAAKVPAGIPKRLAAAVKAHRSITLSDLDGSEWLGLEVEELDTYDWPVDGSPLLRRFKGRIHQCMRKYSDVYFLHPKKRTRGRELAVTFYDHEVGIRKPVERGAGAIFLGHLADYLKLVAVPAKLPKLAKKKIKNGRLELTREKRLSALAQLTSLYTPKELASVKILDLERCALRSTAGIEAFPELEGLRLSDNRIEDTTGLEKLTKLAWLHANSNRIARLDGAAWTALHSLHLGDNRIASLDDLKLPLQLRELSLDRNDILSMEPLRRLPKLVTVKLYDNRIERISALEALPALAKITLHSNPAREMTPESVAAIRDGRATRRIDAMLDDEIEQKYGLVEMIWMVVASCEPKKLEELALGEWRKFLGADGRAVPWTVRAGTRAHCYLTSPELSLGRGHHFFSEIARGLSRATHARTYLLDFSPEDRNQTGVSGWECYADGKMVFDGEDGTSVEVANRLGCS